MRVLYVTTGLPFRQGQESFFVPELDALLEAGCVLRILPRSSGRGEVERDKRRFLPMTESQPLISLPILAAAAAEIARAPRTTLRLLWRIIGTGRLGVCAKNLAVLPKGLYAGRIARTWGADHIHAQWASTTATIAYVAHAVSGVPWSFTAHRWDIVDRNMLTEKAKSASFVRLISRSGVELMDEAAPHADSAKYRVIRMGVAVPLAEQLHSWGTCRLPFIVLCPANLLPVKGHRYLIEAIAELKSMGEDCRLLVAGEGPEHNRIATMAKELGVSDNVQIMGHLPHTEIIAGYRSRSVDAVVLASVDLGGGLHEGIPVALMEAMAHGIPVVSTTTGGISELVTPGSGILVPPADSLALAEAIVSLARSEKLRRQLGETGRKRVAEKFNALKVAVKLAAEMASGSE